jgi:hypothetical protein
MLHFRSSEGPLKSDESSLGNVAHRFRTTRWTVVVLSAQSQARGYAVRRKESDERRTPICLPELRPAAFWHSELLSRLPWPPD